MAIKIVVIDDETQIRRMLRIALTSEGYDVTEAENGQQGLAAVARQQPELVILDLGLPDMEGHQVLQELRGWSDVAVIVLSVRNQDREKVAALDAGAQDYVTKPFSVEELLARVRAILRDHIKPEKLPILDDGKLQIDLSRRLVKVDNQVVELTPKEYAVLSKLASSPNCVVTQTQLLKEIWGPGHIEDTHYLRIVVSHLRQKLGDSPSEPKYVRTEPGVGYRLYVDL
ncbi:DNA-binding response regulator [Marinomonas sp. UCMA 3892]|uniref:response regulator n=1 Tax=Gammaproteobacteria TaxID=1236 RepID=UPI00146CE5E9|nr:response regulator [Shewanella baltica]MCS6161883.1 response regulator [Shewanella baltica]MCS6193217.1 response regulator [Shewanella baltica]MDR9764999.1 response regulator [Shewanella baltica]NLU97970.1 DNA-binding response regulator [Marinomonas sp. UCMA 3892]